MPLGEVALEAHRLAGLAQLLQAALGVADVRPVDVLDLADLRGVDVEVDDASARRELLDLAGDAIVEARADGDQQVAVLDRVVRERRAVHAEHAQRQVAGGVHRADAHQRRHHRNLETLGEFAQLGRRVAVDHPAADVEQWPLGVAEQGEEALRLGRRDGGLLQLVEPLAVAGQRQRAGAVEHRLRQLHVARDVDHHRTGTAAARQLEGAAHGRLDLVLVGEQEDVLGARRHDVEDRRLLERVGTHRRARHLTADQHHRDRVGLAVAHRRDGVGGAGSGGHQEDADPPARARVASGHEAGALFGGGDDQPDLLFGRARLVVAEDGVVGRQDRAAAVAEDGVDALVGQHVDDRIGADHRLTGQRMRRGGFGMRTAIGFDQPRHVFTFPGTMAVRFAQIDEIATR